LPKITCSGQAKQPIAHETNVLSFLQHEENHAVNNFMHYNINYNDW